MAPMALPQRCIEKSVYTEDEYLRYEEAHPFRSEYVRGEICPMPDSTIGHSLLLVGIGATLHSALRGRGCRVLSCRMKVWTPDETIRYPDVSVLQGPCRYRGEGRTVITNPYLIAEVPLDSTKALDRGEKWREYQQIDSLQSYLVAEWQRPRVEQHARLDNGQWAYSVAEGLTDTLTIPALGITLALADIYDGIDFDADGD